MRHFILKDKDIPDDDFQQWINEDKQFWSTYTGITPTYNVIDYDYTDYPTEPDADGDIRPKNSWLWEITDSVAKEDKYATDHIMLVIHERNWKSDPDGPGGIWGTNYSNIYHGYHLQYCRWDKNPANSFGTIYHERHHALDALIMTELGVDVRPILEVKNYDRGITHGQENDWEYIRWKENTDSLKKIAILLQKAYAKRKEAYDRRQTQISLVGILQDLVHLYRELLNRKNGVRR